MSTVLERNLTNLLLISFVIMVMQ